jgi:hypothetical protein
LDPLEFSERRKRARQSGSPAWLWPEVSVDTWTMALGKIGAAATAILRGGVGKLSMNDPKALSLACYTSGVGPLFGWWLEQGLLTASAESAEMLKLHLEHARARRSRIEEQSREVAGQLLRLEIPFIVLKGGHTADRYFPNPSTRPASDLDLLVPPAQASAAEAALADAGFRCVARHRRESAWSRTGVEPQSLWLVHEDDPWSVDVHSSLDFAASAGAPLVRFDLARPFEDAERWALDPVGGALRQPLLLLHLAVHASGGLHNLTLLRIIEIIFVVQRDAGSGRLSWEKFVRLAEAVNGLGAAYPSLRMADKLLPGIIPVKVLSRCAEAAPSRARRIVEGLDPALAHRVHRSSISEHFMWVAGIRGWMRQLASDLLPASSDRSVWSIYEERAYRLLQRRISR